MPPIVTPPRREDGWRRDKLWLVVVLAALGGADYAGIAFEPGVDLLGTPLLVDVPGADPRQLRTTLQRSPIIGVLAKVQGARDGLPYAVAAMTWPIPKAGA